MVITQKQIKSSKKSNDAFVPQPIKTTDVTMQQNYILDLLLQRPFNTLEFQNLSIIAPAARINELQKLLKPTGFKINSKRVVANDNNGLAHIGIKTYFLVLDEQSESEVQGDLFGGDKH